MSDRTGDQTAKDQSAWEQTKGDLASGWDNIKDRTKESTEELTRDHETTAEEFGVGDEGIKGRTDHSR